MESSLDDAVLQAEVAAAMADKDAMAYDKDPEEAEDLEDLVNCCLLATQGTFETSLLQSRTALFVVYMMRYFSACVHDHLL